MGGKGFTHKPNSSIPKVQTLPLANNTGKEFKDMAGRKGKPGKPGLFVWNISTIRQFQVLYIKHGRQYEDNTKNNLVGKS